MSLNVIALAAAEETHAEVNDALSYGVGGVALVILLGLLLGLLLFAGGREHS